MRKYIIDVSDNFMYIIGAILQFLLSATQLKGLGDKPLNKKAWFIFLLLIFTGIITLIKGCDEAKPKSIVVFPPSDDQPKIDVKVSVDKIDGNSFYFNYNITNSGLTEAKNVIRQLVIDDNLFFTSLSGESPVLVNIQPKSTITEDVPITIRIKKDSSTIMDITITYLDTSYNPHHCVFRFMIINNSLAIKEYYPVGQRCLDGYPEIKLPFNFDFGIDTSGLFYAQFRCEGNVPIIILKESLGIHPDSFCEQEINSQINPLWNNGMTYNISRKFPLKLSMPKMPDNFSDSFFNGTLYLSGYLIYTPFLSGTIKRYTFEIRVHNSQKEYIINKDEEIYYY